MKLRILAPFRSHLRLSLGYTLKTGRLSAFSRDYLDFWNGLQQSYDEDAHDGATVVKLLHSRKHLGPDTLRYTTIDQDALRYTAQLIEIRPQAAAEMRYFDAPEFTRIVDALAHTRATGKAAFDKLADHVSPVADSTVIRVFDNNISLFETEVDVSDWLNGLAQDDCDLCLDELREFAVFLGEALIEHYYAGCVFPLVRSICERDTGQRFVDALIDQRPRAGCDDGLDRFEYPLTVDPGESPAATEVLWVTRSLICGKDDADRLPLPAIVKTWLRAVGDPALSMRVADDADSYSTRWLNYLFREGFVDRQGGGDFRDVWHAMQLCQYYYSAVESLNDRLNRVLSFANQEHAKSGLRDLHRTLDQIVRRCELILVNYSEIQKYLKRDKFNAFRDIMTYWNFQEMEKAVREKMALCHSRLDSLTAQSAEKGRLYTDILLMVLSLMAVLDMSISLALFGRSPTDTVYARDDAYSGFILAQFARWQPHWIIIVALVLIVLLGLRFYYFRRKRLLND